MPEVAENPGKNLDIRNETWNFDSHFREYLLLLARKGESALESSDHFPLEIELNPIWHKAMARLFKETNDGKERLALIGFKSDMRELVIPEVFGIGEDRNINNGFRASIPGSVYSTEMEKAKKENGVVGLVGDIHTHPIDPITLWVRDRFGSSRNFDGDGGFSAGDLYFLVSKRGMSLPMMGVVDGKESFFAFKTRQTKYIPDALSMDDFEKYWYEKVNIFKKGGSSYFLNRLIAKEHNLAFYRGLPDENLKRIYPIWLDIKKST